MCVLHFAKTRGLFDLRMFNSLTMIFKVELDFPLWQLEKRFVATHAYVPCLVMFNLRLLSLVTFPSKTDASLDESTYIRHSNSIGYGMSARAKQSNTADVPGSRPYSFVVLSVLEVVTVFRKKRFDPMA